VERKKMKKFIIFLLFLFTIQQEQIILQFTGIQNQYSILWKTKDENRNHISTIKFGYNPDSLTETVRGTMNSYSACVYYKSVMREVMIRVLPERKVYFQVSNNSTNLPCIF
jgi:hypothetical protein